MKSNSALLRLCRILCVAVLLAAGGAGAVEVARTTTALYDLFPQNTQGTNGIWLQYRQSGTSAYTDMNYAADYTWNYPNAHFNLPFLIRSGTAGQILAEPYLVTGTALDPVLRVQVNSKFSRIRVQGTAGKTGGTVVWYIYKGATNWAAPLWQSGSVGSFDFEVDCAPGEELFFGINAGVSDGSDHSYWQDLRLTAVAFPITASPAKVYDYFPTNTQGTAGIRLLSRAKGAASLATMSYLGDCSWGTPAYANNYPSLIRGGVNGQILADCLAFPEIASVLRVQVDATFARIRVQGAYSFYAFSTSFEVFRGATNWSTPVWYDHSGAGGNFDFTVDCAAGDELFFVAGSTAGNGSQPRWYDITLTGIPSPLDVWTAVGIGWSSVSNRWYQVQYSPTVGPTNWLPLCENVLGNGGYMSIYDACWPNSQRFYRVIEIP